jgi:hypothetical protein
MPSPSESPVLAVLRQARDLISDASRWTQGDNARNRFGQSCPLDSSAAVCWCAMGALKRVNPALAWEARNALAKVIDDSVVTFNDQHSHAEVLAAFDQAIAQEEQRLAVPVVCSGDRPTLWYKD